MVMVAMAAVIKGNPGPFQACGANAYGRRHTGPFSEERVMVARAADSFGWTWDKHF